VFFVNDDDNENNENSDEDMGGGILESRKRDMAQGREEFKSLKTCCILDIELVMAWVALLVGLGQPSSVIHIRPIVVPPRPLQWSVININSEAGESRARSSTVGSVGVA